MTLINEWPPMESSRSTGLWTDRLLSIKLVDIAGFVKGASEGQGLGNKFVTHISEVDALTPLDSPEKSRATV